MTSMIISVRITRMFVMTSMIISVQCDSQEKKAKELTHRLTVALSSTEANWKDSVPSLSATTQSSMTHQHKAV